jgi:hypothetical protein
MSSIEPSDKVLLDVVIEFLSVFDGAPVIYEVEYTSADNKL